MQTSESDRNVIDLARRQAQEELEQLAAVRASRAAAFGAVVARRFAEALRTLP